VPTAELVKVAANSFLATKISFINAIAEIAEVAGADTVAIAEAIGFDDRIGKKFLRTGLGFGGGCLPKDIRGFIASAEELGVGKALDFLKNIDEINLRRRDRVVELAEKELGDLNGKQILVLGLSFKPDSDDLRDSPSLDVAQKFSSLGAKVRVHDPMSLGSLGDRHPQLERVTEIYSGASGADLVVLGTEWADYSSIDPVALGELVSNKLVIDGRNVLDLAAWQTAGWRLIALGRNVHEH
jgi:UDPglucose 6-dehydrogenase